MTDVPVSPTRSIPAFDTDVTPTGTRVAPPILGREREVAEVLSLLDNDHVQVLTLHGPGGVGKTRLAVEIMRRAGRDFAHGAASVSLAPVRDTGLVPFAVAQALGVQEHGAMPIPELLSAWLRTRHFLLVLDNMEQVVDAAHPWLTALVASCPRLKVLVTSRVTLDIAGEHRYRVHPLPVPGAGTVDRLDEYASVALFAQRARAVRNDFVLDDANLGTIVAICTRLDGLPLAIELAAARINVFSLADILHRLTDSLTLLTGSLRDAPPRLRSMRDAIAWSYDLLAPAEQELFRNLAVFNGGFTLDAAQAVAARLRGPAEEGAAADAVATLVDHSLVEHLDVAGTSRFTMLETIREFGIAQLVQNADLEVVRDAHAAYFQTFAESADIGLTGPDQVTWYDHLEMEHVNLRDAMTWLTECGRVADALEMYRHIELFLHLHAHYAECRAFLDEWSRAFDPGERSRTRARLLDSIGSLSISLEEQGSGKRALLEALEIFRELGDRRGVMQALDSLSFVWHLEGDLERARSANAENLALARELGDARAETLALFNSARIAELAGNLVEARIALDAALARATEEGMLLARAHALRQLADLDVVQHNDLHRARGQLEEARSLLERVGDKRNLPFAYFSLAQLERAGGNINQARDHLTAALGISRETGLTGHEGLALLELGKVERESGNPDNACRYLRQAMELQGSGAKPHDVADCLIAFAELALDAGEVESAARFLGAADRLKAGATTADASSLPSDDLHGLMERIHAEGGEAAVEVWIATGREWSMEQAIAAALAFEPRTAGAGKPIAPGRSRGLSPRELEVLRLMADGRTNQEIADQLFLSLRTVTTHITGILGKLDLPSRTAAVAYAIRNGLA